MFFDFLSLDDRKPVIMLKAGKKKRSFLRIIPYVDANVFKVARLLPRYVMYIYLMLIFSSLCMLMFGY